jgi:membrane protease YdiL (CAAX protease family)
LLEQKFDTVPWTIRQTFLGILFTLVPWIALAVGLSFLNTRAPRAKPLPPQLDLSNAIIIFIFSSLIEAAFLIAPFYFARRTMRTSEPRQSAGKALGLRKFAAGPALLWIVLLFVVVIVINVLYQDIIVNFHLPIQTNDQLILDQAKNEPLTVYATLLASVLVAPFCEEIFFRGFVFMGLLRGMPLVWAVVFSALIFAVAHADPGSFAVLFCIGLALAFLRWRTRSLWPSIVLHLLNNGIGALLIILTMHGIAT